jgi:hypothetical protein
MENEMDDMQHSILERMNSMTPEQRYNIDLEHTRQVRNNLLEKTDIYMHQFDRFTPEQLEELKIYRQALRNIPSDYKHLISKEVIPFPTPPTFMKLN